MEKPQGQEMYFEPEVVRLFAEREQNEKNYRVANILDLIIYQLSKTMQVPLRVTELGGGAHPDRYHKLFNLLLSNPKGKIDWVDASALMLDQARIYLDKDEYRSRYEVINFINSDLFQYLMKLPNESLNIVIMKYTFEDIQDVDLLIKLLKDKLSKGGALVATVGATSNQLKSISANARFLFNGEEFPLDESRTLEDGDNFTVKFLKEYNNPHGGYLEGAQVTKYYHSQEKLTKLAKIYDLEIFLGDWKNFLPEEFREGEDLDQGVLVLRK